MSKRGDVVDKKRVNPSREDEDGPNKKQGITGKKESKTQPATKIETGCCRPCLPLDVVADILSRLPAKSVARFRCVCRQWLSLTSERRFLKLQHERSSSCMINNRIVYKGEINLFDFRRKPKKSSYAFNLGRANYELSNFVDGLICAYARTARSDTYILNPMIRELKKLPKKSNRQEECLKESFGLGIDVAIRRYKVVRLCSCSGSYRVHCEIYNVGTTRWKSLGEAPFELFDGSKPVFLHGALHWIVYEPRDDFGYRRKECLLRVDIKNEKFGSAISIPSPTSPKMSLACLEESGGKLWLVFENYRNPNDTFFEIWILKDYLNNTWVREYNFHRSSLSRIHKDRRATYFTDIVDGKVLAAFCESGKWYVICYNSHTGDFHKLFVGRQYGKFSVYRESLISPRKL